MRLLDVPLIPFCVGIAVLLSTVSSGEAYVNAFPGLPPHVAAALERQGRRPGVTAAQVEAMYEKALEEQKAGLARAAVVVKPSGDPNIYYQRGVERMTRYLWKNAEDDFTETLRLDPKYAWAYCLRAQVRYHLREYEGCQEDFQRALELRPKSVAFRVYRALAILDRGDEDHPNLARALTLADQACDLTDYRHAECLQVLAAAHARKGDFKAAVDWQKKALELIPEAEQQEARGRLERYEKGLKNVSEFNTKKFDSAG